MINRIVNLFFPSLSPYFLGFLPTMFKIKIGKKRLRKKSFVTCCIKSLDRKNVLNKNRTRIEEKTKISSHFFLI